MSTGVSLLYFQPVVGLFLNSHPEKHLQPVMQRGSSSFWCQSPPTFCVPFFLLLFSPSDNTG